MLANGFYHFDPEKRVYYVYAGRRYWVPNEDALWEATAGAAYTVVSFGQSAQLSQLPTGQWADLAGLGLSNPLPRGGTGGGGGVMIPGVGAVSREMLYGLAAIALVGVLLLALRRKRR